MRIAWISDFHANHLFGEVRRLFTNSLKDQADALILSGDICESAELIETLYMFNSEFKKPIYFVLGNHDFYQSSIQETRSEVASFADSQNKLLYLTNHSFIELSKDTAIVGHDGWADGRYGDFDKTNVVINDFILIEELQRYDRDLYTGKITLDKPYLRGVLQRLGDEAAGHFEQMLPSVVKKYKNVIVVTHVPPFCESAVFEGKQTDDNWLPFMACKATGDVLLDIAKKNPDCKITVLCGHTHNRCVIDITSNLRVMVAQAEYGKPMIQDILDIV